MIVHTTGAQTIYRSVDSAGNPVFSDTPTEGAEEIHLKEIQTISLPPVPLSSAPRQQAAPGATAYTSVAITSPQNDAAIRDNAGNLNISVEIKPQLFPSHTLSLYLDGQEVKSSQTTTFNLENLDRGTHQLRAVIKNQAGEILSSSPSVSFHMLRASVVRSGN